MSVPTTRAEFKETCLRRLNKPVVQINVSDEQVEDRLNYALAKFRDYHFDGSFKSYIAHQVTSDDVTNRYITVQDDVLDVVEIFDMASTLMGTGIWNVEYQFLLTSQDIF